MKRSNSGPTLKNVDKSKGDKKFVRGRPDQHDDQAGGEVTGRAVIVQRHQIENSSTEKYTLLRFFEIVINFKFIKNCDVRARAPIVNNAKNQ